MVTCSLPTDSFKDLGVIFDPTLTLMIAMSQLSLLHVFLSYPRQTAQNTLII